MPVYHLRCIDQIRHHCEEDIKVRLEIEGLTDQQLEAIERGRSFRIDSGQIAASGLELDSVQRAFLDQHGYLEYHIDIDAICDACGAID
ncbi:hypothetical protein [Pseudomonas sp.]|uniref:hypothetical protein n=1 Tax=Pseudomonas sp. TaxID=306 RepID=UPI00272CE8B3|nr:hypothetical protein [Pseudomonas sp.]